MLLAALSQDLYRAALGWHSGSDVMAERFRLEALRTAGLIDTKKIKPHVAKVLVKLPQVLSEKNLLLRAEEALTYSIIIQNATLSHI